MKNSFKSFEIPDQDSLETAWNSDKTLFIFDTNVLLNLYGYEESTRKDFFKVLEKIKEKVWIPYQVGLEYHRRRLDVIKNEKKAFREITSELEKIPSEVEKKLTNTSLNKKIPELNTHLESLISAIKKEVIKCNNKIKEWDKLQPDVRSKDEILDKIDSITKDKIGAPPEDQDWLDKLYVEGAERYKKKLPPGYCDKPKGDGAIEEATFIHDNLTYERQFGDLILWKQMLSKISGSSTENVIFITDDTKKDWWHKIDSAGEKIIGPNEGLKSEIYRNTDIKLFHMYTSSAFLKDSNNILNTNISDSSIEDIQDKNLFFVHLSKSKTKEANHYYPKDSSSSFTPEELRFIYGGNTSNTHQNPESDLNTLSNSISASALEQWNQNITSDLEREVASRLRAIKLKRARETFLQNNNDSRWTQRALDAFRATQHTDEIDAIREQRISLTPQEYSELLEFETLKKLELKSRHPEKDDDK